MNREGNALVEEFKALSSRAKDIALAPNVRSEAAAAASAKLEEIKAKQLEVRTFIENARRTITESAQMAELRGLEGSNPLPPGAAQQRRAEESRRLEQSAARVRLRSTSELPPGTLHLEPKP